ncbi:Mini-ribonuclease 3 [Aerococcus urinaehominis]|uniref:Mini-ribonuclease 3 n=1 Tax=Aerococcus urinaehominis TaxID=128944 RepID=A0A0X8FL23_9LACT|nr:Mini-ribonuclease 3 [Aerococcus urinaehominis]AMB99269.1 Mini-ribonuclease 3 [Aerococcus urinaehominis]SDM47216.1 ribonuclease-3 family protein [Aerococcus urinaehominis]
MVSDIRQINGLALAYLGDAEWEVMVRRHILAAGLTKPNQLHQTATRFVSAKGQARLMQAMLDQEGFLSDQELSYYKRGRNAKSHTAAKNTDIQTYRIATGFEALMGYLAVSQPSRFKAVAEWGITYLEESSHD